MKRILVGIIGFMLCIGLRGQSAIADSLRASIATAENDSVRFGARISLARYMYGSDPDSFYLMSKSILADAIEQDVKPARAQALHLIGIYMFSKGAYERALTYFLESRALCDSIGRQEGVAAANNSIATIYMAQKQYAKALEILKLAQRNSEGQPALAMHHTTVTHNIGICLDELGRHEEALAVFLANAETQKGLRTPRNLSSTYNSIGEVYAKLGRYADSRAAFSRSMALKDSIQDVVGKASLLANIGDLHLRMQRYDSAQSYFQQSMAICQDKGLRDMLLVDLKNLAKVYADQGDHRRSAQTYAQALALSDSLQEENQVSAMANLQAAYEMDEAERALKLTETQAALLDEENHSQRLLLWGLGIALLGTVLITVLLLWLNSRRMRSNRKLQLLTQHTEAQNRKLSTLGSQLAEQHQRLAVLHHEQEGIMNMMAHDLKAPLARSAALLNLIAQTGPLNDEQTSYLKLIERSHIHGQHLIQSLLSLRYLESGEQRPEYSTANADEFISRIVEGYQAKAAEKKIALEFVQLHPLGEISTDYSHVERLVDNLVSNALKFSKSGTKVVFTTDKANGKWWFSVTDQGPGIKPEERDRLFAKFKRLSARPTAGESSTGLGLAIVKLLVESLKGTITVESEVGKGTTFKVELPEARTS